MGKRCVCAGGVFWSIRCGPDCVCFIRIFHGLLRFIRISLDSASLHRYFPGFRFASSGLRGFCCKRIRGYVGFVEDVAQMKAAGRNPGRPRAVAMHPPQAPHRNPACSPPPSKIQRNPVRSPDEGQRPESGSATHGNDASNRNARMATPSKPRAAATTPIETPPPRHT